MIETEAYWSKFQLYCYNLKRRQYYIWVPYEIEVSLWSAYLVVVGVETEDDVDTDDDVEALDEVDADDDVEALDDVDTDDDVDTLDDVDTDDDVETLDDVVTELDVETLLRDVNHYFRKQSLSWNISFIINTNFTFRDKV